MSRLFSIVFVFMLISNISGDICDFCTCKQNDCDSTKNDSNNDCSDAQEFFMCNGIGANVKETHQPLDLNSIQWPSRNTTASATFNNFKLTYLTDVLCSASKSIVTPTLIEINLENNFIEHIIGDPFQYCTNLSSISIALNRIARLSSDVFKSTYSLQRLNVSYNLLSEFNGVILSRCKHITEFDLSHNEITILKVNEILDASPSIEILNAADNLLFAISDSNQKKYMQLQSLNLSGNKMTVITSSTFLSYPSLLYLYVSSNILGNIERNAFEELNVLRILDLSLNNLKDLSLKLPESVEHISFAKNQLKYWPMQNNPKYLQKLELQENELIEIYNPLLVGKNKMEFSSLKFINVSKNHISLLQSTLSYPVLEVFDASYNGFSSIPQYLGIQAPNLKELRLRGNPIKTIEFTTKLSAHFIDLSELPTLIEFDANVFNSIESKFDCLQLILSHNPALRKIRNSFERVPNLCGLDLSYNNLKIIDHNWMNWSALYRGANLQGNPIECTCSSQWLIDFFVPQIYSKHENHHYLFELRCKSPERFRGHRLVQYLNHTESFCKPEIEQSRFSLYRRLISEEDEDYKLLWYQGFGLWLTLILIVIIISSLFGIICILSRRWHRQRTFKRNNGIDANGEFELKNSLIRTPYT